jgi:UDP-N-acetyl-D-mannosaminouronate:lipid I N-acetyl-D-mannosaminouronosyltransferase
METIKSTKLNGYKVYPFECREVFLDQLDKHLWENILVAINAEKIVKEDEVLRNIVNQNVGYPDGIGAVMALKQKDYKTQKIPGAEFWLDIVKRFYHEKTFYLVGAKQNVIKKTVARLREEYSGIEIVNYRDGYIKEEEFPILFDDIARKAPDVVFVAMGSPKQEYVMQKMYEKHKALYMGLGGSFDIYSGEKERAPKVLRKLGLEWSYRLFKEPSRIFRQTKLVIFLWMLVTKKL